MGMEHNKTEIKTIDRKIISMQIGPFYQMM